MRRELAPVSLEDIFLSPFDKDVIPDTCVLLIRVAFAIFVYYLACAVAFLPVVATLPVSLIPVGLVHLYLVLRLMSFYFGSLFATCRRAAFGAIFTDDDRGGLFDLGQALAVILTAAVPSALAIRGLTLAAESWHWHPMWRIGSVGGVVALAYLYTAVGLAVAAVEGTAAPGLVFRWLRYCMFDYFICTLVATIPVAVACGIGYLVIVITMPFLIVKFPHVNTMVFWYVICVPSLYFLSLHPTVVYYNSRGLMARRKEAKIGWLARVES